MRSDPRLKRIYRRLNRRYFSGELADDTIVHFGTPEDNGESEMEWSTPRVITINSVLLGLGWWNAIEMDLVHEMVHLKLGTIQCGRRGTQFYQEMQRLTTAGAFKGIW